LGVVAQNHAVRKVAASRGGKEGNNAFAADFEEYLIRGYETDPDEAGQLIKVTRYLFPATCQQCI
jgi:molybdenum-dependent DNA-binding transcriptional regulator ModE